MEFEKFVVHKQECLYKTDTQKNDAIWRAIYLYSRYVARNSLLLKVVDII